MADLKYILTVFVWYLTSYSSAQECCPPLWTQLGSSCYRFVGTPQTWSKAEQQCLQLAAAEGKDGHMVSIHSREENTFVSKLWKTSLTPVEGSNDWVHSGNAIWLGLSDQVTEGDYLWSDESGRSFTSWRQGEPSGDPEENCGHMWTFGDEDTNWNDASCGIKLPFVCKLNPNSSVINSVAASNANAITKHVCEHQTLHLECGPDQGISILSANYGRLDRDICSDNPWNTDTDSCALGTTLDIVRANCEKFRSCDVAATYDVFGNPCGDVFKYLEVSYVCSDRVNTKSYVCEGQNLHLECPIGQSMSIESANFGRTNRDLCSNTNLDTDTDTCRIFNTLSIVKANCEGTRDCDVAASITMFGNPCPNIHKYLEVTYSCQKSTSTLAYACEHSTLHLQCSEDESLFIRSANYGRLHRNICSNNPWNKNNDTCGSDTAVSVVRQACENYQSCDLPATNEKFGNPCGDIYKYLEVEYACLAVDNSKLVSAYACEFDTLHLECGPNEGISILSANYGRLNTVICSDNSWNTDTDTCYSATALGILRSNCETYQECNVGATNQVFGNPCGDVFKYAEVMYVCQDRESLRRHACEHDTLHLECGEDEVISIEYANYGRTDRDVCSNNDYNKNADTCRTYNAQYIVGANCNNVRSCDVPATNIMFGNPCGDVFKYLDVIYKCVESTTFRAYACENGTLHLACRDGEIMTIQSANYGRLHRNVCAHNNFNKNTQACQSNTTLSIVQASCDHAQTCDVEATNEVFENPCGDVYKYLEVFYTCQETLDQQQTIN